MRNSRFQVGFELRNVKKFYWEWNTWNMKHLWSLTQKMMIKQCYCELCKIQCFIFRTFQYKISIKLCKKFTDLRLQIPQVLSHKVSINYRKLFSSLHRRNCLFQECVIKCVSHFFSSIYFFCLHLRKKLFLSHHFRLIVSWTASPCGIFLIIFQTSMRVCFSIELPFISRISSPTLRFDVLSADPPVKEKRKSCCSGLF